MTLILETVCKKTKSTIDKNGNSTSIANMYWNRWLKEYIPTLTPRLKWTRQTRNFKIGDLVIIKSKYIPQNHWPLGQVIETFVASDDIICSIKVKTPSSEPARPSNSLFLLENLNAYAWNWTSSWGREDVSTYSFDKR